MKTRERNAWSDAVARQIKAERAAARLTQKVVYEAVGMSPAGYKRIEAGTTVVDASSLAAILAVLHVPASKFYARVEERIIADMHLSADEALDLWAAIAAREPQDPFATPDTGDNPGQTGT